MTTPTPVPGKVLVQPPPLEAPTYGLFSVATFVNGNGKWQIGGVEYYTDACAQGHYVEGFCPQPVFGPAGDATFTASPAAKGHGVVVATDPEATTGLVIGGQPPLHGPVTIRITPPGGTAFDHVVSPDQSVRVPTPEDGEWKVSFPGTDCPDVTAEIPYPQAPVELFGTCEAYTWPVVLSVPAAGDFPVEYRIVTKPGGQAVSTGTVQPGTVTTTVTVPAGDYTLIAKGPDGAEKTKDLKLPGDAVSIDLTSRAIIGSTHEKKKPEGLNLVKGGDPFTVIVRTECNTIGFPEASATAMRRLACIEQREAEHYFSKFLLGDPDVRKPLGDTAVGLKQAIGALEADASLMYCGRPTFHAPRWAAGYFSDREQLQDIQGARTVLRTVLESKIAFGGGYFDNPFDPVTPPEAGFWLVATGSVRIYRAEPFVHETFDAGHPGTTPGTYTSSNTRTAVAEREYAIDHDCYHAAVLVSVVGEG